MQGKKKTSAAVLAVALGGTALAAGSSASATRTTSRMGAEGPAGTWAKLAPATAPSARFASAMAYDQKTGQFVLYGGAGPHGPLGGTWTWDGTTWAKLTPTAAPSERSGATMAYDPKTGQLLLFGGFAVVAGKPSFFSGTWAWGEATWSLLRPALAPPPLAGAAMAYDAATGQVVLFGGAGAHGVVGGTWAWDGANWAKLAPATAPPARSGAAMAYDAATRQLLLFGGAGPQGTSAGTWAWDGADWSRLAPATSPSERSAAAMAYDPASEQVVLFGGSRYTNNKLDLLPGTWAWDGADWLPVTATGPVARSAASMAYDPATGQLVMFGGGGANGPIAGTWAYTAAPAPGATTTTGPTTTTAEASATTTGPSTPTSSTVPATSPPVTAPPSPSTTALPPTTAPSTGAPTTTTTTTKPLKQGKPLPPGVLMVARDGKARWVASAAAYNMALRHAHLLGHYVVTGQSRPVVVVLISIMK